MQETGSFVWFFNVLMVGRRCDCARLLRKHFQMREVNLPLLVYNRLISAEFLGTGLSRNLPGFFLMIPALLSFASSFLVKISCRSSRCGADHEAYCLSRGVIKCARLYALNSRGCVTMLAFKLCCGLDAIVGALGCTKKPT